MSLSEICAQQHDHEQKTLKRLLLWGILGSLGAHGLAFSLSQFTFWQAANEDLSPIELIVTEAIPEEPEPLPDPEQPTQLSTETNNPAAAAASAPPRPATVVAPPTSPPPTPAPAVAAPAPDSVEPETLAESELAEPMQEVIDPEPDATPAAPQSESLRDLLQRLRGAQNEAVATESPGSAPESATAGTGTRPNAPTGDDTGVAAAPSTTPGSGQGPGSRTVACQDCVRPSYPQSALDARIEGQPVVSVDINPDGTVSSVTLTRSSGNAAIDQAAMEAARRSRFQPVAGGTSVPIEYDLNIEGSRRNRDARRRGDRESVEVPTPPAAATPETPPAAATTPPSTTTPPAVAVPSEESPGEQPPAASPAAAETPTPEPSAAPTPAAPSQETPAPEPSSPAPPTPPSSPTPASPTPAAPNPPAAPPSVAPPPAVAPPAAAPPPAVEPTPPAATSEDD